MGFLTGTPSQQQSSSTSSMLSGNLALPSVAQSTAPSLGLPSAAGGMMAQLLGIPGFGSSPSNTSMAPGATVGGSPSSVPSSVTPSFNSPSFMDTVLPQSKSMNGASVGQEDFVNNFGTNDGSIGSHLSHTIDSLNNGTTPLTGGFNGGPFVAGDIGGANPGPIGVGQPNPVTTPFNPGTSGGFPGLGIPATNPDAGSPTPVGGGGAPSAGSALDNFSNSAGMDFIRGQGVKAIEASQAGKGMLDSGATGQALSDYGTNLGKTYLNNYLQDLGSLASVGQNQTNSLVDAGRTMGSTGTSSGSGTGAKQGLLPMLIQSAGQAASAFA